MKAKFWLFPLVGIYFFLISATSFKIKKNQIPIQNEVAAELPTVATKVTTHRFNFFQKLVFKILVKKEEQIDNAKADNLAGTSLALGIGTWAFYLFALAVPILAVVSIPMAIGAMITGSSAIRSGTTKAGKAKIGKGLGLASIITIAVLSIVGLIFIASGGFNWN